MLVFITYKQKTSKISALHVIFCHIKKLEVSLLNILFQPIQPEWNRQLSSIQTCKCADIFSSSISYVYEFECISAFEKEIVLPGIPDGCLDLIFNLHEDASDCYLVPSPKIRQSLIFKTNTPYFGIRLLPLQTVFQFDLSITEINQHTKLPLFDTNATLLDLYEQLLQAKTIDERKQVVENSLIQPSFSTYSNIVTYCMQVGLNTKGNIHIKQLEQLTGYSERYLRKLFQQEIGMSPKPFFETIYFQFMIQDMLNGAFNMNDHLVTSGLYDISHFYKKFKKFTSMTPAAYKKLIT